jgi:hypothetical protein
MRLTNVKDIFLSILIIAQFCGNCKGSYSPKLNKYLRKGAKSLTIGPIIAKASK